MARKLSENKIINAILARLLHFFPIVNFFVGIHLHSLNVKFFPGKEVDIILLLPSTSKIRLIPIEIKTNHFLWGLGQTISNRNVFGIGILLVTEDIAKTWREVIKLKTYEEKINILTVPSDENGLTQALIDNLIYSMISLRDLLIYDETINEDAYTVFLYVKTQRLANILSKTRILLEQLNKRATNEVSSSFVKKIYGNEIQPLLYNTIIPRKKANSQKKYIINSNLLKGFLSRGDEYLIEYIIRQNPIVEYIFSSIIDYNIKKNEFYIPRDREDVFRQAITILAKTRRLAKLLNMPEEDICREIESYIRLFIREINELIKC